jgi:hypothetical protein
MKVGQQYHNPQAQGSKSSIVYLAFVQKIAPKGLNEIM